ncbi:Wadjet anti-phage system protein JetD domain-containing protein [Hymenobacter sp. CRA2]|uniref:Wadjet anti-phage system protein JetD domain-containing protein n=1 Tax=Hymenobacter sp. CRA2 TaxID=1955620 RepID=UPI00098EB36A|nr:DUF3322 and DUF2220 domain-containing protein [Hymenobacter sp. CRA2]OON65502.1 hypothetical protein B0919_24060 [Hymenobacter sp. CRA2]
MLTVADLRRKVEKKYVLALGATLPWSDEPAALLFPWHITCGKLTEAEIQGDWLHTITQWVKQAKPVGGFGYELRQHRVNTRTSQAWQTVPQEVIFHTPEDVFAFLGKTREAAQFKRDAALVLARLPQLHRWLLRHVLLVTEYAGHWESLIRVGEFFLKLAQEPADAPRYYLRELRIEGVHTKFIEQHTRPLRLLLDELLPSAALRQQENSFLRRYNLREPEPLIRLRILDEQLSSQLPFQLDDLTIPISKFAGLEFPCKSVLIVENLTTFLALPPLPETLAVWGKGFQVSVLATALWLRACRLLYWGDLDTAGLQILHHLRGCFPHTQALLMDDATLKRYAEYHTTASTNRQSEKLSNLTCAEEQLFRDLAAHQTRLEQEHIPLEELLQAFHADVLRN